jgi:hypothetical protein
MKMHVFHHLTPGTTPQPEKLIAINEDEVLRMAESDTGTEITQSDKGPTLVKETLEEVMKAMGQQMPAPTKAKAAAADDEKGEEHKDAKAAASTKGHGTR